MTPEQFLAKVARQPLAPVYLFLGQEGYQRQLCKEALLQRALPGESRIDGLTQTDLEDRTIAEVVDDARSLSLFAQDRVIWVGSAELALPRRLVAASSSDEDDRKGPEAALLEYLKAPTPGTVVVLECSRYDFNGDDKPKMERVQQFFNGIRESVEFRQFTPDAIRFLAQQLAKQLQVRIGGAELAALLDSSAGDATRLAAELEKLSLYVGSERAVTLDDISALVPNASQSTIFALVNALGKRDRPAALKSLDILVRDGEYLPLALSFLSTLFRLALVAKESRISSAQQAQALFQRLGVRMWRDRAEQVVATAAAFSQAHLNAAVSAIYETDKKLREGYKDDKLIMETLILTVT